MYLKVLNRELRIFLACFNKKKYSFLIYVIFYVLVFKLKLNIVKIISFVPICRSRAALCFRKLSNRFFSRSKSVYVVNNASGLVNKIKKKQIFLNWIHETKVFKFFKKEFVRYGKHGQLIIRPETFWYFTFNHTESSKYEICLFVLLINIIRLFLQGRINWET